MREHDYQAFATMLDRVCVVIGKGNYRPDAQSTAVWFRALEAYGIDLVRRAFDAHVRDPDRGRFVPTPADIVAKIHAADGRVSSDEAWAIAVKASDESATVTWNDEIAEAWGAAAPVWATGDKVGARMAFRDAYTRIVEAAKRSGKQANWWPSLGHDSAGRLPEVRRAAASGQLSHDAPLALEFAKPLGIDEVPPRVLAELLKLREQFVASDREPKPEVKPELPPLQSTDDDAHGTRGPDLMNLGLVGAKRRAMEAQ